MKDSKTIELDQITVSVIGSHAGESSDYILNRKKEDIENIGATIWIAKLTEDTRTQLSKFEENDIVNVVLIGSRSKQKEENNKNSSEHASVFSEDNGKTWLTIPEGLSPVTGNFGKNGTWAFYVSNVNLSNSEVINLGDYVDTKGEVLKFNQFCSTKFAIKSLQAGEPNLRRVVAILTLKYPFFVKVR